MTLRVRSAIAPLLAEPRISSEQISQRLFGHPLTALESRGDYVRVRGGDGYEGWTHQGYLVETRDAGWRLGLGCTVADATGALVPLPLGALIPSQMPIIDGGVLTGEERGAAFPATGAAVTRTARSAFAGTTYQWGGVSPWGADCSGFVQTVFWLHGLDLPRDAWQQALTGIPAAPPYAPADLLFFSEREDRRPTHVGIALADGFMAHVAVGRGGHAIDRLDDRDPYVASLMARLVGARTVMTSSRVPG